MRGPRVRPVGWPRGGMVPRWHGICDLTCPAPSHALCTAHGLPLMTHSFARTAAFSPTTSSARRRPGFALGLVAAVCLAAIAGCATPPGDVATRYGDAATAYATGVKVAPGTPLYF